MSVQPEELLVHADFIRQIAKKLILDQHSVADITQDTLVAALETPPVADRPLRAWLGAVTKNLTHNLIRRESRRAKREWVVSRPAHVPSTAEIVEHEETRQKVVQAVLGLKAPYRSVVLLRFYQDLPPRKIAEALDLPVETVKTRLKRGLEQLRQSLDSSHGGNRQEWCLALAPIAGLQWISPAAGGTMLALVAAKAKPALFFALLMAAVTLPILYLLPQPAGSDDQALPPLGNPAAALSGPTLDPEDQEITDRQKLPPSPYGVGNPQGNQVLRGRVKDLGEEPVAGAKIQAIRVKTLSKDLTPYEFSVYRTQTDEEGVFSLAALPPGEYGLIASENGEAGHRLAFAADPSLHPAGSLEEHEIVIRPSRALTGRIRDAEGTPLAGVHLAAYSPWPGFEPTSLARTDAMGCFVLPHLSEAQCHLLITREDLAPMIYADLDTWQTDLDVRLVPGRYIRGRVTLDDEPAAGVEVSIGCAHTFMVPLKVKTQTGEDGFYQLGPLPDLPEHGFTPIQIKATDLALLNRREQPLEDERFLKQVDITLSRNGSAFGRVLAEESGLPLEGVWVTALADTQGSRRTHLVRRFDRQTQADGSFHFPSLPPGDYLFYSHAQDSLAGSWADPNPVRINSDGETTGIDFQLAQGARLRLCVKGDHGSPLEGVKIRVINADRDYPYQRIEEKTGLFAPRKTLADGTVLLQSLPSGTFEIQAEKRGWCRGSETVTVQPGKTIQPIDLELAPAFELTGQVTALSGRAIPGASLSFDKGWSTFADSQGRFRVTDMVPCDTGLRVTAPDFMELYQTLAFAEGMAEPAVLLRPAGSHQLRGRVTNKKGQPLAGARITVEQKLGNETWPTHRHRLVREDRTDADGQFKLQGLIDLPVTPRIHLPGFYPVNECAEIPVDTEDLQITLSRFARVNGRVTAFAGEPVPPYQIFSVHNGKTRFLKEFKEPDFSIRTQSGEFMLRVKTPSGMQAETGLLSAGPGETLDPVRIQLGPSAGVSGRVLDRITQAPVSGASLDLRKEIDGLQVNPESIQVIADKNGGFTFPGIQPGRYQVEVTHKAYCLARQSGIQVRADSPPPEVELFMSPGCTVSGRVFQDGQGLSGVPVTLPEQVAWGRGAVSGSEGRYQIDRVTPGSGSIRATLAGDRSKVTATHFLFLDHGKAQHDFHFGQGIIKGRVTAFDSPAESITIEALRMSDKQENPFGYCLYQAETQSRNDGSFAITDLPPGRYQLLARWIGEGRRFRICEEVIVMNQEVSVDLRLGDSFCGEVHGVVWEGIWSVPGIEVSVEGIDLYFRMQTVTDSHGRFHFSQVPAGEMKITALDPHQGFGKTQTVNLEAGDSLQQDIAWEMGSSSLSGKVICLGEPAVAVPIQAVRIDDPSADGAFANTIAQEGKFLIENLPAGRYHVTAERPWNTHRIVEVKENQMSHIDIHYCPGSAQIQGRVIDPEITRFEGSITVFLFKLVNPLKPGQILPPLTLADGLLREQVVFPRYGNTFNFSSLPAGVYELSAAHLADGIVGKTTSTTVSLTDGESLVIELDFAP